MKLNKKKPVANTIGAVVIGSFASADVMAESNPFGMQQLESGYMQVVAEGNCGGNKSAKEGKSKDEKADKEGKCGGEHKAKKEGKCGGEKAKQEGKCGEDKAEKEGKCGSDTH
ncbi:hypothetical protein CA267_015950 [Alteromonas pelagimontana]|uniref:Low-complexity protein n=1 Tax=Alteromonas pelagimontana TaxID=1858656 RepID=A0A6M4MHS8_9ALTE|nr:hypothetical protein [Alteromonas pelagimontana]QJR82135.1 hypothetical protein CA267_015950 [Alteromonas pelagimontana]